MQEILGDAAGELNLAAGFDPDPLEVFSTDFTELPYANWNRKAYLMAVVDLESKYVSGWAFWYIIQQPSGLGAAGFGES